jgi:hypothetical protein
MALVWVTGRFKRGKSTVCAPEEPRELSVDADFDGLSHWVDRTSGQITTHRRRDPRLRRRPRCFENAGYLGLLVLP